MSDPSATRRLHLNCGWGSIPDVTDAILSRDGAYWIQGDAQTYLNPKAVGEFVAACVNCPAGYTLKFGSLGFGCFDGVYWALGSDTATVVKDFGKRFHTWAEDADGRVVDVVNKEWHELAAHHNVVILVGDPQNDTVLEGVSREELRDLGLRYVPAPVETQNVLRRIAETAFQPVFEKLKDLLQPPLAHAAD